MVSVYDSVRKERKLHCWRHCCACHCVPCVVLLRHSLDLENVASGRNEIEMQEWQACLRSESKRVLIMRIMGGNTALVVGLSCNLACDQPQTVSTSCMKFLSFYGRGWLPAVTCSEEPLLRVVGLLNIDQWLSVSRPLATRNPLDNFCLTHPLNEESTIITVCNILRTLQRCKQPTKMQQLFRLLIFLIQPYMFRATNSPILRSTLWLYIHLLVQCTDTAANGSSVGALNQKMYIQS